MKTKRTPEKMTLTRIYFKKPNNERTFDCLTKLSVQEALQDERLKDVEFVSSRKEEITLHDNPNCIDEFKNGFLVGTYLDSNPNDDELMKITPKDVAEMEENEEMINFYESLEDEEK